MTSHGMRQFAHRRITDAVWEALDTRPDCQAAARALIAQAREALLIAEVPDVDAELRVLIAEEVRPRYREMDESDRDLQMTLEGFAGLSVCREGV